MGIFLKEMGISDGKKKKGIFEEEMRILTGKSEWISMDFHGLGLTAFLG